jgi:gamma-glutamylcysteine synthetase
MKSTRKPGAQVKPEASDEQIAARIRALAANPATPAHVQKRVSRLLEVMTVEGLDSVLEDTPVMMAEQYRQAASHAATAKAKKAKAELVALVERYATEEDAELDAFAHHLAEALRIARTSDSIPQSFYNSLAEAWNDCTNELECFRDATLTDSKRFIRLALEMEAEQKGGVK